MSDEIKEILDKAKEISGYGSDGKQHTRMFNQFEAKALLDYITNLQTIEREYSSLLSENAELQQENDRLNNIIKDIKSQLDYLETYSSKEDVFNDMKKRLDRIENIIKENNNAKD